MKIKESGVLELIRLVGPCGIASWYMYDIVFFLMFEVGTINMGQTTSRISPLKPSITNRGTGGLTSQWQGLG